jgi:hypothetical protein
MHRVKGKYPRHKQCHRFVPSKYKESKVKGKQGIEQVQYDVDEEIGKRRGAGEMVIYGEGEDRERMIIEGNGLRKDLIQAGIRQSCNIPVTGHIIVVIPIGELVLKCGPINEQCNQYDTSQQQIFCIQRESFLASGQGGRCV